MSTFRKQYSTGCVIGSYQDSPFCNEAERAVL